ncbi:hypothetical protein PMAYCL1PPCAC_08723, partial [Pristionchus mayeri]
ARSFLCFSSSLARSPLRANSAIVHSSAASNSELIALVSSIEASPLSQRFSFALAEVTQTLSC